MPTPIIPGEMPADGPFIIDTTLHALTGAQLLYHALRYWQRNPDEPVLLWALRGDTAFRVNGLRVALSKERKARKALRTFRVCTGDTWPFTLSGVKGEVVKLTRTSGGPAARAAAAVSQLDLTNIYAKGLF